jgi:hypothetical protein
MSEERSDFGKGLVICLVKFAEHFAQLARNIVHKKRCSRVI